MDAGLVVITVTGFSIPFGPQNYSLAVQACPENYRFHGSAHWISVHSKLWQFFFSTVVGSARTMHASGTATPEMTLAHLMSLQALGILSFMGALLPEPGAHGGCLTCGLDSTT